MDDNIKINGTAREVREIVEAYYGPEIMTVAEPVTGATVPALVTAKGQDVRFLKAEDFDGLRERPVRRTGTTTLLTVEAFIEFVNRFRDDDSIVFADNNRETPSLTAIIDYHRAGAEGETRWGKQRAKHLFPLSDEWKAWLVKNGKPMSQLDFAMFLEDRIIDVLMLIADDGDELSEDQTKFVTATGGSLADPSTLLALSISLKVNESSSVSEQRNLSSGEGEVVFQNTHDTQIGRDIVRVPTCFLIGIPVFGGGVPYRILARLRYRKREGALVFWYELWRTDRVFDHAFDEAVERVHVETTLPVLLGKDG